MAEKKLGTCSYCGKEFSKVALKRHYMSCDKNIERQTIEEIEDYFFISVEDRYMSEYWLYISVSAKATLKDIDKFLNFLNKNESLLKKLELDTSLDELFELVKTYTEQFAEANNYVYHNETNRKTNHNDKIINIKEYLKVQKNIYSSEVI